MRSRLGRVQAERKATRHKSKFQEIVDEHEVYQESRQTEFKYRTAMNWLVWTVAVAVVIAALYFGSLALKYAVTSVAH